MAPQGLECATADRPTSRARSKRSQGTDWRTEATRWRRQVQHAETLCRLGSFEIDLETGLLTGSAVACALFGLPPGRPVSLERVLRFAEAAMREAIGTHLAAARRTGEACDLTIAVRSARMGCRRVRMIGQVETVGGSARLVGVVRDVTGEDTLEAPSPRAAAPPDHDGDSLLFKEVMAGLARGEFEVHYQPIVDLRTQVIRGWEALVRWRHPTKGLLLPGAFLAALLDATTSVAIGDFVLGASLGQMRQWLDAKVPVTCAGVNVSEGQLKRGDLVTSITTLLEHHGLTADRLKIEVLETAFIGQSMGAVAATIDQLARLGVVSALDDFGTGYASLTHLKQFRVERIKIDRSFIANLGASGFDQAIVRCLITLGRDLGIRITAEGIETQEQLAMLRALGCDCGQGYLFGRPMPAEAVPGFLERWQSGDANRLLGAIGPALAGAAGSCA